jgi:uncharacterized protein (TIGR03382 family)
MREATALAQLLLGRDGEAGTSDDRANELATVVSTDVDGTAKPRESPEPDQPNDGSGTTYTPGTVSLWTVVNDAEEVDPAVDLSRYGQGRQSSALEPIATAVCRGDGARCLLRGDGSASCDWGAWRCSESGGGYCAQSERCQNASSQERAELVGCGPETEGEPCHLNGGEVGECGVSTLTCRDGVPVCQVVTDGGNCQLDGGELGRIQCIEGQPYCGSVDESAGAATAEGETGTADCLMSATHDPGPPWVVVLAVLGVAIIRRRRRSAGSVRD